MHWDSMALVGRSVHAHFLGMLQQPLLQRLECMLRSDLLRLLALEDHSSMLNCFCRRQDGTSDTDRISDAAINEDGYFVLVGWSGGLWGDSQQGNEDFAAVKLDADGGIVWQWQVSVRVTIDAHA